MDIGKLNVKLMANASQFAAGMDQSQKSVKDWSKAAQKDMQAVTTTADRAGAAFGALRSAAGSLARWTGLGAGLSAIGGALSGAAIFSGWADLEKTDLAARAAGASIGDYRAALHLGGAASAEFVQALGVMQDRFVQARLGSHSARRELAGLAAVSGTTADALERGGWAAVVDHVAAIRDPAIRSAQAFRLMGQSAGAFLHTLRAGGAAAARDTIRRLGLGVTDGDMASVRQAAQAVRDLQLIASGVWNQILVGLAPVAAKAVEVFGGWTMDLTWIKGLVVDVAEGVALGVAYVREAARDTALLRAGWDVVWRAAEVGFLQFKALALDGIREIGKALHAAVFGKDTRVVGIDDVVMGTWGGGQLGGDPKELSKAARAARDQAREVRAGMDAAVARLTARLGGTEWGAGVRQAFADIRKAATSTGDHVIDAMGVKVSAALYQSYQRLAGQISRPAEAFRETAAQVRQMQAAGLFADGGTTRGLMGFRALQDLLKGAGMSGPTRFPQAMEAYSREAYNALAVFQDQGRRGTIGDEIKTALEAIRQIEERQAQIGELVLRQAEKTASNTRAIAEQGKDDGKA